MKPLPYLFQYGVVLLVGGGSRNSPSDWSLHLLLLLYLQVLLWQEKLNITQFHISPQRI